MSLDVINASSDQIEAEISLLLASSEAFQQLEQLEQIITSTTNLIDLGEHIRAHGLSSFMDTLFSGEMMQLNGYNTGDQSAVLVSIEGAVADGLRKAGAFIKELFRKLAALITKFLDLFKFKKKQADAKVEAVKQEFKRTKKSVYSWKNANQETTLVIWMETSAALGNVGLMLNMSENLFKSVTELIVASNKNESDLSELGKEVYLFHKMIAEYSTHIVRDENKIICGDVKDPLALVNKYADVCTSIEDKIDMLKKTSTRATAFANSWPEVKNTTNSKTMHTALSQVQTVINDINKAITFCTKLLADYDKLANNIEVTPLIK
jgi:hypothetical protein